MDEHVWGGAPRSAAAPGGRVAEHEAIDEGAVEAAAELAGAADLFLFRRVTGGRWVHLGGVGRGKGWAGNVELLLDDEPFAHEAVRTGRPQRRCEPTPTRVFGPYYARSAVVVPCSGDVLVVLGNPTCALTAVDDDTLVRVASAAAHAIDHVSPAKRLADELEILHAVKAMLEIDAEEAATAMRAVAERAAGALSCELGLVYQPGGLLAIADLGAGLPVEESALRRGLEPLWHGVQLSGRCVQDATAEPLPGALAGLGIVSYFAVPIGEPRVGMLVVAHTDAAARGFTSLCQELGRRLAEAAETVLRTARLRESLRGEIDRLGVQARRDALTGLVNRLAWDEALERAQVQVDAGTTAGVMIVDVDELKRANDTRGHTTGDLLIQSVARCLRVAVRDVDLVARIGGDEFAVLLPGIDEPSLDAVAERLQAVLADHPDVDGIQVRAAVGAALCPPGQVFAEATARADARMYRRKHAAKQAAANPGAPTA